MGLLSDRLLWLSALGALLSGGLLAVVVGYVALVVYSGLVSGAPLVGVLVEIGVPVVLATAVLVSVFVGSAVGFAWALARNATLPRSERLGGLAARAEEEYPPLRAVGLAELLSPPSPTAEEREEEALAALKRQYVDGEITEAEFERKVDRLVATESVDEARAERERERVVGRE